MGQKNKKAPVNSNQSLELVSNYVSAIQDRDGDKMGSMRSLEFVLDLVAGDAFDDSQRTESEAKQFWPAWFKAFPDMDYQVTRTIVTETVVVTEWRFMGTNAGKLDADIFGKEVDATQKTIRFRGVSIYEIINNLVTRETLYMDLATLWVELGVSE